MNRIIHKTKISFLGLIITGLFLVPISFILISNSIDFITFLFCIVIVLTVLFPQFSASVIIEFYKDSFIIKYPLLKFLPSYKDQQFKYSDIEKIVYRYKLREPNRLEISFNNSSKKWFWCRFRFLSSDKEKISEIFDEYNVDLQYRRFSKIKKFNDKEWVKMK